ncbi:MAG TPA: UbiA family prenyltransferase [Pseudobdellovibrionaceae bacterium]|nr:UbiA family prenyltransferase [Pseudobdellovibrionaceae bacterium]
MKNWVVLVRERFNPLFFIPLIALFVAVNGAFAQKIIEIEPTTFRYLTVFILALSFFFRLRLFDDIKDLESDREHHPQRPFPKGLLTITQAKRVIGVLILFELALTFNLGFWPFVVHMVAILFSLLMFEDFFIGEDLNSFMTLSSLTHFFVVAILALSVATSITGFHLEALNYYYMSFFMVSWFLFNLYEFSRKTYAPDEEKKALPSYSKSFTHIGATALTFSQSLFALMAIAFAFQSTGFNLYGNFLWTFMTLVGVYFASTLFFVLKPSQATARIFRASSLGFIFSFYLTLLALFSMY